MLRRAPTSLLLIAVLGTFGSLDAAGAESAWIRGEVRLNVRTGAGTQFRILDGIKTGDHVEVLERREEWVNVALDDGVSGWIPVGYLQSEPPATLVLELLEEEAALLRRTSATNTKQLAESRTLNASLTLQDEEQRLEIDQLRRENVRLKAGARWPEWITGAAIVGVGMIVGAILQRSSGRRSGSRIRL